jgi:sarcosine oxidase
MTNKTHYDVIVIGVGSMGSSACWHLAERGLKVLGLEQFSIVHEKGSHSGQSRIIRKAYFEHPDYVPLLERAYENWDKLESLTKSHIYHKTGIVYFGQPANDIIEGTKKSANLYNIPLEQLSADESRSRFPQFCIPADFDTLVEPDSGFITPEFTIKLYTEEAIKKGAVVKANVKVKSWEYKNNVIEVVTDEGTYSSEKIIITAGSWSSKIIPGLQTTLKVTRQTLAWINPDKKEDLDKLPCWFISDPVLGVFYGFPLLSKEKFSGPTGLKVAHHFPGKACDPDKVPHSVPEQEEENIRYVLRKYLPGINSYDITFKQCLYTYSEDADFIIDHLPGYDKRVTIACGFSGHGFKFVSVVGEILADLTLKGKTDMPIGFLGLKRFTGRT